MAVKINQAQRDAIYAEAILALSGTGDIRIELDNGDFESARRHRRRFEDVMRLLDDIGWEPDHEREEFELSMPRDQLIRAVRDLNESAGAALHTDVVEPMERREATVRTLAAQTAYGDVLAQAADADKAREA
jgi:hypothetical protein